MKKTPLIVVAVLVLAVLGIPKIPAVQQRILNWVGAQAGVSLTAEKFSISTFGRQIEAQGLLIRQQAEDPFPAARIRHLALSVNPLSFLGSEWEISRIDLDVEFFHLLKDHEGGYSLFFKKPAVRANNVSVPAAVTKQQAQKSPPQESVETISVDDIKLGEVRLKIGRVQYEDYSRGNQPLRMTAEVNTDHYYEDVENMEALVEGLTQDVMTKFKALHLSF